MARKAQKSGVFEAREKLRLIVPETPLLPLMMGKTRLLCKCESDQPMGAFKLRGAWHRLTALSQAERAGGVVAFSSGNHALGVAWSAQRLGIEASIIMPADAPRMKVEGTRALGAEVIFYDRLSEDRIAIATDHAARRGAKLVPSFDDPWIIEGQGSAGAEVIEQMEGESIDMIVTPCGGGGLAAGLCLALPAAKIVIVEPEGWDDMGVSLRSGSIVGVVANPPPTLCDALQTPLVSPLTFDILKERGAEAVSVTEEEVLFAMGHAWYKLGKRIEPGGAVALAAILAGKVTPAANTLVMLSGGNVDQPLFERALTAYEAVV